MPMISADFNSEGLYIPNEQYSVGVKNQSAPMAEQLIDVSKLTLVRVCSELIIAPKESPELYKIFDKHIDESLVEIAKTFELIHPAYVKGMLNYTHIFDTILDTEYKGAYIYGGPIVRFNGAKIYARENPEFYERRPLAVVLERGERHNWLQGVRANYFDEISSVLQDESNNPSSIYLKKVIKESQLDFKSLPESQGLYYCDDLTCVISKK